MVTSESRALACDVVAYLDFFHPSHLPHFIFLSVCLTEVSCFVVGGEKCHIASSPKSCLHQLTLRGLWYPTSSHYPCLHESLCWGRHQSCRNRTDLSSHPISMKCCFLLNWEQCWLYTSHTLQSADEYISPSILSWHLCRVWVWGSKVVSLQGGADPTMSSPPLLLWQAVMFFTLRFMLASLLSCKSFFRMFLITCTCKIFQLRQISILLIRFGYRLFSSSRNKRENLKALGTGDKRLLFGKVVPETSLCVVVSTKDSFELTSQCNTNNRNILTCC